MRYLITLGIITIGSVIGLTSKTKKVVAFNVGAITLALALLAYNLL